MRITDRITWDMNTGQVLEHEWHEYSGTVALAKGDGTAKDQLKLQNKLVQEQLAYQKSFMDPVKSALQKYLQGNGEGFTPEQMATLNSQFLDSNANDFQSAGQNVKAALASRGAGQGDVPIGGDYVRGIAELEGAKAQSQSGGLSNIRMASIQQALQNKFNAANVFGGNSAQVGGNVGTFNSGAGNALNTYVSAANTGFGNAFSSAFGGSLGKGLGSGLSAGITGGISGLIPTQYGGTKGG